ncbi:MAG: helix-turn-helix transcriptional regulator [Fibrobacteres bacterium]|nr:helix-turn-helix transcriptional regulator [Fibrobacterota bacterium]
MEKKICHPYWSITYSITDCGYYKFKSPRNPWHKNSPGTVWLIPPKTPFWENFPNAGTPARYIYIDFMGGEIAGLKKLIGANTGFACFSAASTDAVRKMIVGMAETGGKNQEGGFLKVMSSLFSLIDLLLSSSAAAPSDGIWSLPEPRGVIKEEASLAEQVRSFFLANLPAQHAIDDLANKFKLSTPTLYRQYKKETGESPMQTLTIMRIESAKSLLLKGAQIKSIIGETGFYDESHFSKTFKQLTGITPKQFRLSHKHN